MHLWNIHVAISSDVKIFFLENLRTLDIKHLKFRAEEILRNLLVDDSITACQRLRKAQTGQAPGRKLGQEG